MEYLQVDPAYLAKKMTEHNMAQKALAGAITGGDGRHIRFWLSGEKKISKAAKAAIWYYFKLLEGASL